MTRRPDLTDLELLVAIAESGSIGRTASARGLSQPSVSRRMVALERVLQLSLLVRTPRGSALTANGRVVVDWAAGLLGAVDDFSRSVQALVEESGGAVRAAVSMTIAEHYAPRWVAAARIRTPETEVSLVVANSTEVADLVAGARVDVGFIESPTVRPGLRRRRIGVDHLVVAVATDHPWATREVIAASELALTPLLVREAGSGTRETIERALRSKGLPMRVAFEMASNTALKSAAVAGMGPAVVSAATVTDEVARGQLRVVPVQDLRLSRPLSLIWRRDAQLSKAAQTFLEAAVVGPP